MPLKGPEVILPLAQLESQAKAKWVVRLDKIAEAAGSVASINSIEGDEEGMLTLAEGQSAQARTGDGRFQDTRHLRP